MAKKGWYKEPGRHSLAAKGIKTYYPKKSLCVPHKSVGPNLKVEDLGEYGSGEYMIWMEDKNWIAQLDDGKDIHLGLLVGIINWPEAIGDDAPDKEWPVGIYSEIYVVPKEMSKKFKAVVSESAGITPDEISITDVKGYSGGVPSSTFMEGIKGHKEPDIPSKVIKWKDGRVERYFKNEEDAKKYVKQVYTTNAPGMFMMVGFQLDKPFNRVGNTGWDIIKHQKKGIGYL